MSYLGRYVIEYSHPEKYSAGQMNMDEGFVINAMIHATFE